MLAASRPDGNAQGGQWNGGGQGGIQGCTSGRNTARAPLGGEWAAFPLSVPGKIVLRPPLGHVSASPPLIPDGRISRVRLAAAAFPQRTFPYVDEAQALARIHPYQHWLYLQLDTAGIQLQTPALCPAGFPIRCPPLTESPFAHRRCYPLLGRRPAPPRPALPGLHYSYWLMRRTECLPSTPALTSTTGLCRLLRAPAGRRSVPALSPQSLHRSLDPYPATTSGCTYPFLPRRQRPRLRT